MGFSSTLLVWGLIPPKPTTITTQISAADLGFQFNHLAEFGNGDESTSEDQMGWQTDGLTAGEIQIDWPEKIRSGDLVEIRLEFIPDTQLKTISGLGKVGSEMQSGLESKPPLILYAQLELPGLDQKPSGTISQPISFNNPVIFLWRIRAHQNGNYSGDLWLKSVIEPGSHPGDAHKVVLNRGISISAEKIVGLNGVESRLIGTFGSLLGLFLEIQIWISKKTVRVAESDRKNLENVGN